MLATSAQRLLPPPHSWWRPIHAVFTPGPLTPLLEDALAGLTAEMRACGHAVQPAPDDHTEALITTARFGAPIGWRDSLMMTGRRRFGLKRTPTVFTLLHITPAELDHTLTQLARALARTPLDPADFAFPGLAPQAYHTLIEQGRRGGPIMALIRLAQAQTMGIRVIALVGEAAPQAAYYFDLVGMHPRTLAEDRAYFYQDMLRRVVTAVSTCEVTQHEVAGPPLSRALWEAAAALAALREAGRQFGRRSFFTQMIRVADLVHAPALSDAISSQYSEGCFATWDPLLNGLVTTITGSARPVEKENITEDELAVIVDVRADGLGAVVRHVEGKRNDPPSSEAVELRGLDLALPWVRLGAEWGPAAAAGRAPVVRSKLHGHRGITAYNSAVVEFVPLEAPYYHYPVSCSTQAQAQAIKTAFGRAECLRRPEDPRRLAFTVLPGHGVVIVEKWIAGYAPLQAIWEAMDAGDLLVAARIPQGLHH